MRGLCFVVAAALTPVAMADVIVFEPDNYANGTDLRTVVPGITLSHQPGPFPPLSTLVPATDRVLAVKPQDNVPSSGTSTGILAFGTDADRFAEWSEYGHLLRASFSFGLGLVTGVSIDLQGNNGEPIGGAPPGAQHEDFGFLAAYRADNSLIMRVENVSPLLHNESIALSIFAAPGEIAYILAGGNASTGDALVLDNLQVTLVPAPGVAAALTAFGLVTAARRRR